MRLSQLRIRSLRSKILLYSISVVLVIFTVVFVIFGVQQYTNLQASIAREVNLITREIAQLLDSDNEVSSTIPKIMALAQEAGMFGDREASAEYARRVLELHPNLTGAYFGYERDADGKDAAYAERMQGENADLGELKGALSTNETTLGRFIPYWFRDESDPSLILLEPLVDMETSLYYQGNKNKFQGLPELDQIDLSAYWEWEQVPSFGDVFSPRSELNSERAAPYSEGSPEAWLNRLMITEPYDYEGKLIFEQTYPISIDDGGGPRFVGIAGVDQALDDMKDDLASKIPPQMKTAGYALISRGGRIIASTFHSEAIKALPVEKLPDESLKEALGKLYRRDQEAGVQEGRPGGLLEFMDEIEEVNYLYDSAEIPTGEWTLVMRVGKDEVYGPLYSKMAYLVAIFVLGLLIIVLVLSWLTKSVAQRITVAARAAEQVARGDLTGKIEIVGEDETGQLLGSITTMTSNLNALIGQVKKSSIVLTSTATKISANAKAQESVVNDFGSSTTEIAAAIKEITATSQELSKTMNDVTSNATETANLADSGRDGLVGMEQAMDTLTEANTSISSKLAIISERAKNINQVVDTISKVADQTNMLSLNASIEAEKAGEYGLGFSVVAREVKRLADQTAVATLDIGQMVRDMQSSVSAGVMEMDKFTEHMRQGNDTVRSISSQLSSIIEHVQELTEQFETVRQGMDTQTTGAQQINSAMIKLTEAAHSTSTSVSASNQATSDLRNAVDNLRKEVTKFKVDRD